MSETSQHRRTMLVLSPGEGVTVDAGKLLAMLRDAVELHPEDETHLWGSGLLRDSAPPSAVVEVNEHDVTLTWSSADVDRYIDAWNIEKERRAAIKAEQETVGVADGTSDSV